MAPADLLQPLEGQREVTLRLLDTLRQGDLEVVVRGDGRTVQQILCHLVDREHGADAAIRRALAGAGAHLSQQERDEFLRSEMGPFPAWGLAEIRAHLVEARESLRRTFRGMSDPDLDQAIRWPEWPARTIRTSIPYLLEHEDSHLDEVREALRQAGPANS